MHAPIVKKAFGALGQFLAFVPWSDVSHGLNMTAELSCFASKTCSVGKALIRPTHYFRVVTLQTSLQRTHWVMYCLLLCALDYIFLLGNRAASESPGILFQLVSSIWEEWRKITTSAMFCHVHKLFACYALNIWVFLNIFLVSFQHLNACQSREFDLKGGLGSCAVFLVSFRGWVLLREWIPLPVFHGSMCFWESYFRRTTKTSKLNLELQ